MATGRENNAMESGISEEMRASEKRVMATPGTVRKLSASDPPQYMFNPAPAPASALRLP